MFFWGPKFSICVISRVSVLDFLTLRHVLISTLQHLAVLVSVGKDTAKRRHLTNTNVLYKEKVDLVKYTTCKSRWLATPMSLSLSWPPYPNSTFWEWRSPSIYFHYRVHEIWPNSNISPTSPTWSEGTLYMTTTCGGEVMSTFAMTFWPNRSLSTHTHTAAS